MPPDHEHNRDDTPKSKEGPQERELAVALTVAVLNASSIEGPLPAIAQMTLDVYDRVLGAILKPVPVSATTDVSDDAKPSRRSILALDAFNYLSAGIVGAQIFMVGVALIASRYADGLGRKPVFAFGIGVLIARGVLFALTTKSPNLMVAVQVLDRLGAGIYNVVWVLVAADLARGTGRFNLLQGVFATAQGLGGAFSNVAAGFLATAFGFPATFLTLAAVAGCALTVFVVRMPETCAAEGRSRPARAAA